MFNFLCLTYSNKYLLQALHCGSKSPFIRRVSRSLIWDSGEAAMDIEPGAVPAENPYARKLDSFKSLKVLDVDLEDSFDEKPFGVEYGRLENGLTYYVRRNAKPKMRAALTLAVKVGSVLEEENERGVAHIAEHLAFSATTKYTNHDLVKFIESIGAEFGPCQNASTSPDETVYELFVPIDRPELLSQAISVLAEFSSEVRISKEDLEKERGAVMEEYRLTRNASGRMEEARWMLMMEGSKYADRLPIGLEKVIRTVPAETVKKFYHKWYQLSNMAIIAVGEFPGTKDVVEVIQTHFSHRSSGPIFPLQHFPVPPHKEPRYLCFVDREAARSSVSIYFKMGADRIKTVNDYREVLVESMFIYALNQRFYKISRRDAPPYFSCAVSANFLVQLLKAFTISASCKEKGALKAFESILIEIARIRLHGFSECEIKLTRASLLSEIESSYLERDQIQSSSLRDECVEHFIRGEPMIGIEYNAQLQKSLLPSISAAEVSKYAEKLKTSCSCVIETIEARSSATINDLKTIVIKIIELEKEKTIPPWDDEHIPEELVDNKPSPGNILHEIKHSNIGATELLLSNGLRVCYKCTDFYDDEVVFAGFSYGGLSELSESEYLSCMMGSRIAGEIGVFGHKPSVLKDMLASKRVDVRTSIDIYTRSFYGSSSPSDLEAALQLVYLLFMTNIAPREAEVKISMQLKEEEILAEERDPYTVFYNRSMEINYGHSYFLRPVKVSDLRRINPSRACEYFSLCFNDPSSFTVVLVGNIYPSTALPLILQYLGGIPKPPEPLPLFAMDYIKGLPLELPTFTAREVVRSPMMEAQCSVQLCFPLKLDEEKVVEEKLCIEFLAKLLEKKLTEVLRFKHGKIYYVGVSEYLDGDMARVKGHIRGTITIYFSCDPKISSELAGLALDEVTRLQVEGPSDADVATILEIDQRNYENGLQENGEWLERILSSYQLRTYSGDVGTSFKVLDEGCSEVRKSSTPVATKLALRRILPYPCQDKYTLVILLPQRFTWLRTCLKWNGQDRDARIVASIAGVAALAFILWRSSGRV